MPGRQGISGSASRNGYQGQYAEKDPETGYDAFDLRLYDSRIGRWLSTDPDNQYWSPYMANGNNPVSTVDPTGGTGYSGGSGGGYGGGGSPGGPGGGSGYASMYGMLGFAPGGYQNAYGSSGSGASGSNANAGGYALANLISGGQTEIGVYAARPQTFSGSNYSGGSMYASNLASTAGTAPGTGNLGGSPTSGFVGGAPAGFNDGRGLTPRSGIVLPYKNPEKFWQRIYNDWNGFESYNNWHKAKRQNDITNEQIIDYRDVDGNLTVSVNTPEGIAEYYFNAGENGSGYVIITSKGPDPSTGWDMGPSVLGLGASGTKLGSKLIPILLSKIGRRTGSKIVSKAIPEGFKLTKKFGYRHGQKVYEFEGKYYSKDIDGHNGGVWKVFKEVGGKLERIGTADKDLNIFKH